MKALADLVYVVGIPALLVVGWRIARALQEVARAISGMSADAAATARIERKVDELLRRG